MLREYAALEINISFIVSRVLLSKIVTADIIEFKSPHKLPCVGHHHPLKRRRLSCKMWDVSHLGSQLADPRAS